MKVYWPQILSEKRSARKEKFGISWWKVKTCEEFSANKDHRFMEMGSKSPRGYFGRLSVTAAVFLILLIGIQSIDSKVGRSGEEKLCKKNRNS